MNIQTKQTDKAVGISVIIIVVVIVVLVVVVFGKGIHGFESLLEMLGLKDSAEKKKNTDTINSAVAASNNAGINDPWNVKFYTQKNGAKILTQSKADGLAAQIWGSVGYLYDTPNDLTAALKQCTTQSQVSFVSLAFYNKYGKDLLGWLQNHFDTTEQTQILANAIEYVQSLPKFN
jgi:hypothetical protein